MLVDVGRAQSEPPSSAQTNRQADILQQQKLDRLKAIQERALRAVPPPSGAKLDTIAPQVQVPDIGAVCSDITEIALQGDTDRVSDYRYNEIRPKNLISRGLVTKRAYLPAQDLRSCKLAISGLSVLAAQNAPTLPQVHTTHDTKTAPCGAAQDRFEIGGPL